MPKTLVWQLCRWRNAVAQAAGEPEPIPVQIIEKPPSAELAPGQLDSDRLPDYTELDEVLDGYVERDLGHDELIAAGFDAGARRARHPAGRPRRVQAPPVPAGPEGDRQGLRPRPPAAHHLGLARTLRPTDDP